MATPEATGRAMWTGIIVAVLITFGSVVLLLWGLGADIAIAIIIGIFVAVVVGGGIGLLLGARRVVEAEAEAEGDPT